MVRHALYCPDGPSATLASMVTVHNLELLGLTPAYYFSDPERDVNQLDALRDLFVDTEFMEQDLMLYTPGTTAKPTIHKWLNVASHYGYVTSFCVTQSQVIPWELIPKAPWYLTKKPTVMVPLRESCDLHVRAIYIPLPIVRLLISVKLDIDETLHSLINRVVRSAKERIYMAYPNPVENRHPRSLSARYQPKTDVALRNVRLY